MEGHIPTYITLSTENTPAMTAPNTIPTRSTRPLSPPPTSSRPTATSNATFSQGGNVRSSTAPTSGSQTQTQTQAPAQGPVILRLRGASLSVQDNSQESRESENSGRRVQWAEGVVNNEGLGRKSSKVCCIYHAPRNIDSSSDESSSDESSDESGDDGGAKPAASSKRNGRPHNHDHDHGDGGECKGHGESRSGRSGKTRNRSPNAYEKMPSGKGKGKE